MTTISIFDSAGRGLDMPSSGALFETSGESLSVRQTGEFFAGKFAEHDIIDNPLFSWRGVSYWQYKQDIHPTYVEFGAIDADGHKNTQLSVVGLQVTTNAEELETNAWTARLNSGNDEFYGNRYRDVIRSGNGDDLIHGHGGDDVVYGGAGNDRLFGESGKDAFVFDTKPSKWTNKDTICDFNVADDIVWIDNAVFTKTGANGALKAGAFWASDDPARL